MWACIIQPKVKNVESVQFCCYSSCVLQGKMSNFDNSQPSYLRVLLDEMDPEEIWDSCFTSTQFYNAVPSPEPSINWEQDVTDQELVQAADQTDIELLWSDKFSTQEFLSVKMNSDSDNLKKQGEQCAKFDLGFQLDASDDDPDGILDNPPKPV